MTPASATDSRQRERNAWGGRLWRAAAAALITLPVAACLVPDAAFQAAAGPTSSATPASSTGPAQAYAVDPIGGGRLPIGSTSAEAPASSRRHAESADAEVGAFAADGRHPLFELVRSDMARLMRQGRAADLQSAYDQAVAARAAKFRAETGSPSPRP